MLFGSIVLAPCSLIISYFNAIIFFPVLRVTRPYTLSLSIIDYIPIFYYWQCRQSEFVIGDIMFILKIVATCVAGNLSNNFHICATWFGRIFRDVFKAWCFKSCSYSVLHRPVVPGALWTLISHCYLIVPSGVLEKAILVSGQLAIS